MADKTGLKNEEFLKRIQEKGSTALKGRNPFGVNVFSGSVNDDGVISGKVSKPKYNNQELVKSVDTNIFELLPPEIPEEPDVVPRPIYNEALARIDELEIEVEDLKIEVSDLTALVNELRITTQSLRIDLDAKDLLVASVENRNQATVEQSQAFIIDLQNSIQRATSEAIERTSFEAVNESLTLQIDNLNEVVNNLNNEIQSLNTQLTFAQAVSNEQAEGAYGGADTGVTANPIITDSGFAPITWRGRPGQDDAYGAGGTRRGFSRWINGESITIFNPNEESLDVSVRCSGFDGVQPITNRSFTVAGGGRFTYNPTIDLDVVRDKLQRGRDTRANGSVLFTTSKGSFEVPVEIQIQIGPKYDRP